MITISSMHEVELKLSQKPAILRDFTTVTVLVLNAADTMKAIEAAASACAGQLFPRGSEGSILAEKVELEAVRRIQEPEYTLTRSVLIVDAKAKKTAVPITERQDWEHSWLAGHERE